MNKTLPDTWIRRAIFEAIDNMEVNGMTIPCYDTRVTGPEDPCFFVLMTTQSNSVDKGNKCEYFWESTILLDIVTVFELPGNPGDREPADDILNEIRSRIEYLQLDPSSGLSIITRTPSFPNDLNLTTETEVVFRKFISLDLVIK